MFLSNLNCCHVSQYAVLTRPVVLPSCTHNIDNLPVDDSVRNPNLDGGRGCMRVYLIIATLLLVAYRLHS